MSQVQIFEIDEEDEEEYHPRRPKYSTIVYEEEYEDEEYEQPKGWDFHEDEFFPLQ